MKHLILLAFVFLIVKPLQSQVPLPDVQNIDTIHILTYWGNIDVQGRNEMEHEGMSLEVVHTDSNNKSKNISTGYNDYVTVKRKKNKLLIRARESQGFESVDLNLIIPSDKHIDVHLIKGGEIRLENCNNGIEVSSMNGSVVAQGIGKYAIINATNGSIKLEFDHVDPSSPISLVTMNGEISVELPEHAKRDLRLLSRKNGYVWSGFDLDMKSIIPDLNKEIYSKMPIDHFGKIGGGGALLFMSTENGPLIIRKKS